MQQNKLTTRTLQ